MRKLLEKEQKKLKSLVKKSTESTKRSNENFIAYCGLYCSDGFFYKGEFEK